jgi:hypothetical protein
MTRWGDGRYGSIPVNARSLFLVNRWLLGQFGQHLLREAHDFGDPAHVDVGGCVGLRSLLGPHLALKEVRAVP